MILCLLVKHLFYFYIALSDIGITGQIIDQSFINSCERFNLEYTDKACAVPGESVTIYCSSSSPYSLYLPDGTLVEGDQYELLSVNDSQHAGIYTCQSDSICNDTVTMELIFPSE